MNPMIRAALLHGVTIVLLLGSAVCRADDWPDLPVTDGSVVVPAQEWPHQPGPRTVAVHLHYPSGNLANVGSGTGLMLTLHNWGGTACIGTADPRVLANEFNVVAICVDYLQSGAWNPESATGPYDFGYLQALDALRALYAVQNALDRAGIAFDRRRIFGTGGSGGGNVALMANKLAPRTFACVVDLSGMAKLTDDIAYGLPDGSRLNAAYSRDAASPKHLTADEQELRFIGHPGHLSTMKHLGNSCRIIIVHGEDDDVCPVADAREMVANMQAAGLDVHPHFVTKQELDGSTFLDSGHSLGDRTQIVLREAGRFLDGDSPDAIGRAEPSDFDLRGTVRYETTNGAWVISYEQGFPVGRFEKK